LWGHNTIGHGVPCPSSTGQGTLSDAWRYEGVGAPCCNRNALKDGLYTRDAIQDRKTLRTLIRCSRELLDELK
jgi:hypothetical protein